MFSSIRRTGKSIASFFAHAAAALGLAEAAEAMPAPINAGVVAPPPPAKEVYVSKAYRSSRIPHSNRKARQQAGIPHGTSGAKLARKALNGTIGK